MTKGVFLILVFFNTSVCFHSLSFGQAGVLISKSDKALMRIVVAGPASDPMEFAAAELSKYLFQISGATFQVYKSSEANVAEIRLIRSSGSAEESFMIEVVNGNIYIKGGSGRAVLYGVYDFLQQLGCRWLAPSFDFYEGKAEIIPRHPTLYYQPEEPVWEEPVFKYRKLDIEEGLTHTAGNLKELIDWMPKLKYNILMVPLDYGGSGRVKWDNWRKELTPELKKRGLLIEVGGHGYENFINAGMKVDSVSGKTLFDLHPGWFGSGKDCLPSRGKTIVFNTENDSAVNFFLTNIRNYIKGHPEIDIFECWPPDGARWNECAGDENRSLLDRQSRLIGQVDSTMRTIRPDLKLEMIAYDRALLPPPTINLPNSVLVDFCPINQSFETPIWDADGSDYNQNYIKALLKWRKEFSGDIGLYSYYRKYKWRSLPNIIPRFIKQEMEWYARVPLQGITVYSEPGDWGTYDLNYYVLGKLAWNPGVAVDPIINEFCEARFNKDARLACEIYSLLEESVRKYGSIAFTTLKSARDILNAHGRLEEKAGKLKMRLRTHFHSDLNRLLLAVHYAILDLTIQSKIANGQINEARSDVFGLVDFLRENKDKGVFVLDKNKDRSIERYMKHYQLNSN